MNTSASVSQRSVLAPLLWNILFDGVLGLKLVGGAVCVGFADDPDLVMGVDDECFLMNITDLRLDMISTWTKDHRLKLAPDKTEVLLMKKKKETDHIAFSLDGIMLKLKPLNTSRSRSTREDLLDRM